MARGGLEDATAVVVGPPNALLRACVTDLATRGADVLVVTTEGQGGAAVEIEGARAVEEVADDDIDAMQRLATSLAAGWPPVRVLVNAHMAVEVMSIEASTMASWERVVRSNVLGPVVSTKAFLPLLKQSGAASIVHVGSIDGTQGNPALPSYSASKGALVPLTHVMADEFAPFDIRVNCVARAALNESAASTVPASIVQETPLGRAGEPHEVAAVIGFLAAAESSYVTGTVVVVDGGRTGITPGTRSMVAGRR